MPVTQEITDSAAGRRLRHLLQAADGSGVEVPVNLMTTADQAGTLANTLRNAIASGAFANLLTQNGKLA